MVYFNKCLKNIYDFIMLLDKILCVKLTIGITFFIVLNIGR